MRFGLASWSNAHFDHILYPLGTPHLDRLPMYAGMFPVVEADVLHHRMPDKETLRTWAQQAPEGFRFLPKMHKSITHASGAPGRGAAATVPGRTATGDLRLFLDALAPLLEAGRMGPVLLQYAKDFRLGSANLSALEQVLASAPPGTFAVELRHASWWQPNVRCLLEDHGAPLVWSTYDAAPAPAWATGRYGYVRFVGTAGKTRGRWVTRRDRLGDVLDMRGRLKEASWDEVYVIVTNRFEGNAVDSLPRIAAALGETELATRCTRRPMQPLLVPKA